MCSSISMDLLIFHLAGWLAGWLCWLCWLPGCAGWVAVLAGWLLELREHGQERVNWCWPGSYNKRVQMFTRRQTTRVLDCELPNCRTIGLKATYECRNARTSWTARITRTANYKRQGMQGLPNANLISYSSQPGGPQGAGGYICVCVSIWWISS